MAFIRISTAKPAVLAKLRKAAHETGLTVPEASAAIVNFYVTKSAHAELAASLAEIGKLGKRPKVKPAAKKSKK